MQVIQNRQRAAPILTQKVQRDSKEGNMDVEQYKIVKHDDTEDYETYTKIGKRLY